MDTWMFVTLILIGLFIFLIFVVWLDWIFKCRKSAKENNLTRYLSGFLVFNLEEKENELIVFDGILGINETQLVFAHRFQNEAVYMSNDISNICGFALSDYDDNEFLDYVGKHSANGNGIVIVESMAGISVSKRLPKKLKTRRVCKIRQSDGWGSYFFYKNTTKNDDIIEGIQKSMSTT